MGKYPWVRIISKQCQLINSMTHSAGVRADVSDFQHSWFLVHCKRVPGSQGWGPKSKVPAKLPELQSWIFPLSAWPRPECGLPELTSGPQDPGHTPWKKSSVTLSTRGKWLWRANVIRKIITLFTCKGSQNCAFIFSFVDAILKRL